MRSGIHGTFATLMLLIPVLSIPALAIFGIPQFAPVVASPLDEGANQDHEHRVGQSERLASEGLMADLNESPLAKDAFSRNPTETRPKGKLGDSVPVTSIGRNARAWNSEEIESNHPEETMPRNAAWADDAIPENHRSIGSPATDTAINPPGERRGFDQRYAAAPIDSRRPGASRAHHSDLVPAEQSTPRPYHRDRESGPASSPIRQVSNVREPLTWQGAIRRLNELEIRNFRLERGHRENQFVFICSFTPSDSPRVSTRFEAEADEPLKAVEKVLEQIDEWRIRR